ncbi:MAG: hypothetical protein ACLQIB_15870 [Isosphaeraceae bacterium]
MSAAQVIADRLPCDRDLASHPMLSRFENMVSIADLRRLQAMLVDLFIQSFDRPPGQLTFDAAALNLLVRLRHAVVWSPPTTAELGLPAELPTAAIDVPHRKRFFNKRRERDPLGEGFACTWRARPIKVAAEIITRA